MDKLIDGIPHTLVPFILHIYGFNIVYGDDNNVTTGAKPQQKISISEKLTYT